MMSSIKRSLGILLFATAASQAAITVYDSTGQSIGSYATFQSAVNASSDGYSIIADSGTYTGTGNRDIDLGDKEGLTIECQSGGECVIDCEGGADPDQHRAFVINDSKNDGTIIRGLTIKNGYVDTDLSFPYPKMGGGVYIQGVGCETGCLGIVIEDCSFENCHAIEGGCVYIADSSTNVTFNNCSFKSTRGDVSGGGIFCEDTEKIVVNDCVFSGLQRTSGAAISVTSTEVDVFSSNFVGNGSSTYGSIIENDTDGTLYVDDCVFKSNYVSTSVIYNAAGQKLTILGCAFLENKGKCIFNGTTMEISDTRFINNSDVKSAIYCDALFDAKIKTCIFLENEATGEGNGNFSGRGGAITCNGSDSIGRLELHNCGFYGNYARRGGGAIHVYGTEDEIPVNIVNCEFSGNSTDGNTDGGAIRLQLSRANIINCTFAGNIAQYNGGAISLRKANWDSQVVNCVIWGNESVQNPIYKSIYDPGKRLSVSYSCVEGGDTSNGNIIVDPMFLHMPNDGGDGWFDVGATGNDESANNYYGNLRLRIGSPCADEGDNTFLPQDVLDVDGNGVFVEIIPIDLDGFDRVFDDDGNGTATVDMGAFESPRASVVADIAYSMAYHGGSQPGNYGIKIFDPGDSAPSETLHFSESRYGLSEHLLKIMLSEPIASISGLNVIAEDADLNTYPATVTLDPVNNNIIYATFSPLLDNEKVYHVYMESSVEEISDNFKFVVLTGNVTELQGKNIVNTTDRVILNTQKGLTLPNVEALFDIYRDGVVNDTDKVILNTKLGNTAY